MSNKYQKEANCQIFQKNQPTIFSETEQQIQEQKLNEFIRNLENYPIPNYFQQTQSNDDQETCKLVDSQVDQNQQTGYLEVLKPKKQYQLIYRDKEIVVPLQTSIKKGSEDICYYLISCFNSEQDRFASKIITMDSNYIKPDSIQKDDIIITAFIYDCKKQQMLNIYKQMVIYAFFFDQFIEKYVERAWQPDFKGDSDILDLFVEDVINVSQRYIYNN
ncbi:hypothetical protein ABPG74_005958 [Tetrahymena malaccensis]